MSPSSESLRSQIYVLTALLSDAQHQRHSDGFLTRPDYDTSQSTAGKTVQHIATLLTRGTEDRNVAVTAGPVGANHFKIILSTARSPSAKSPSPSISNETNSKESDESVASAADEHPIPNSSFPENEVPLVREATLPTDVSEEVRKMLLEQEQSPSVYPDFFQYLPKVFEVLKYAATCTREDRLRADLFFVTQCRSKISQRIHALFTGYDMEHLRTWEAESFDPVLQQREIVIEDKLLAQVLLYKKVPLVPGMTNKFIFDSENAVIWLRTLLNLLNILKEQVDVPAPLPYNHDRLMHNLLRLSYLLSKIPTQFWSLQSLSFVVAMSRGKASHRAANLHEDNHNNNEDEDDDLDVNLPSRTAWNNLPRHTLPFVRALHAAFACITARKYLSHSTILKQPITISYRALELPAQRLSPLLESDLLFDEWFKAITDKEAKRELIQTAHKHHDNLNLGLATGACHCESTLMSALVAREQDQSDQTFLAFARDVNRLLSITQGLQDIGVAKKSCASCWLLAAVIKEEMNIDVRLPGTHSLYYPWIAPPHLPENILLRLKDRLLERLVSMVTILQSRTSSPASAISESLADEEVIDSQEFMELSQ